GDARDLLPHEEGPAPANRHVLAPPWQEMALRPGEVGVDDGHRHDRRAAVEREDAGALANGLQRPVEAAGSLRKDPQDVARLEDPDRGSEGLEIGSLAIDRMDRNLAHERADDRNLDELALAEPVHRPPELLVQERPDE